ncbi:hypothetical protein AB9K32_03965 [Allomuricauda sp. XS_ASV26]|uniref:DUF3108 domain-containing protein n=1 Tax=Allomuricauda sp. XS_ASV26 TaxID=3241292 RepID=UPI003519917E
MKNIIVTIFGVLATTTYGQQILTPKSNNIEQNALTDEAYTLNWYMVQDSIIRTLGKVDTEIIVKDHEVSFVVNVRIPNATTPWVDTTIVKKQDFAPIYHSSYNQNRDMVLKYGNQLTGYYFDKKSEEKTIINESLPASIFDSSSYPQLIRCLPYEDGFSAAISIFDYNPKAKIGELSASINQVTTHKMKYKGSTLDVWKVDVTDDISDNRVLNTYYISKSSRKLLKHIIDMNGRKMIMERETP